MKTREKFEVGQVVRCDGATFSPAYGRITFVGELGVIVKIFHGANNNYKFMKGCTWPFGFKNIKAIKEATSGPVIHCFACDKPVKDKVYLGFLKNPANERYTLVALHPEECYDAKRLEFIDELI